MKGEYKRMQALAMIIFATVSAFAVTTVTVGKAGTLASVLSQEQQDTCTALTIKGKLNSADIKVLRRMAGWADGEKPGRLAVLDLQQAAFVRDDSPFMVLDAADCMLAGTAVPDRYKQTGQASSELWGGERSSLIVVKYRPRYVVGSSGPVLDAHREDEAAGPDESSQRNGLFAPEGDFRFATGITDDQWRDMKDKYGITTFRGHRLEREGNRYLLYASSVKNTFLADMFYGCLALRKLVLSHKVKMDFSVADDTARYSIMRKKGK